MPAQSRLPAPREGASGAQNELLPGRAWKATRLLALGSHQKHLRLPVRAWGRGGQQRLDPGQAHCGGLLFLPAKRKVRLVHPLRSSRQRGGCLWPRSLSSSFPGGPSAAASHKEASRSPKLCPRGQPLEPALLEGQGKAVGLGARKLDTGSSGKA